MAIKGHQMKLTREVAICGCIAAMVFFSWLTPLERLAHQQIDAGLTRALASFASARALNAVISVIQGTELAFQPAGIGVTTSVGQILHPVNNVIEQFAHLMLIASVAFGVEKVLISIGAHWLISLTLTAIAAGWCYLYLRHSAVPTALTKVLLILLMIRFAMPVAVIGADMMFHQFMADDYQASQTAIDGTTGQLSQLQSAVTNSSGDQGAWDKFKEWATRQTDIKSRLVNLMQAAEHSTERAIKLMVIFVLQTLLLPIFMLWALWSVTKGTFATLPSVARLH